MILITNGEDGMRENAVRSCTTKEHRSICTDGHRYHGSTADDRWLEAHIERLLRDRVTKESSCLSEPRYQRSVLDLVAIGAAVRARGSIAHL